MKQILPWPVQYVQKVSHPDTSHLNQDSFYYVLALKALVTWKSFVHRCARCSYILDVYVYCVRK